MAWTIAQHYSQSDGNLWSRNWRFSNSVTGGLLLPANEDREVIQQIFLGNFGTYELAFNVGAPDSAVGKHIRVFAIGDRIGVYKIDAEDFGDIVKGPIYAMPFGPFAANTSGNILEVLCSPHIRQQEDDCNVAYDYRTVSVTMVSGGVLTKLLEANVNRVALSIQCTNAPGPTVISFSIFAGIRGNALLFAQQTPFGQPFPYRDWGPIIRDAIWYSNNQAAGATLSVTETWRIPK